MVANNFMKLIWQVENEDIAKVKEFYELHKNSNFVVTRIKRNINKDLPEVTKDEFWIAMVSCLLTTQQRSGPTSRITQFINSRPFPLEYELCKSSADIQSLVEDVLTKFGGIRRAKTIGEESDVNFKWLESGGWEQVFGIVSTLLETSSVEVERESAKVIMDNLRGFGPKQSRNLLQMLGLTKFEIPIDSRITKWLTDFGFPIKLSATALGDENYYNFVQDGFRKICEACDIYPCVMDAVIFSSFDEEWPEGVLRF